MDVQDIEAKFAAQGLRTTASRREVVDGLLAYEGHMTADDLYESLRKAGSGVGRMTVFRTLDLLAEIGVIRPIYQGSGAAHFVLLEDGHHHHLVCIQCAETVEFDDCSLADDLTQRLATQHQFKIAGHMLEIYGVCSSCQVV